ncbi:MAG TPA: DUF5984 family protein [Terracidiphilus sp.]|jgi:hypothetical protein
MSDKLSFRFELDPVGEIVPWGEGEDRKLHWFGLTSGRYWIMTPLGEVLRYTDEACRAWEDSSPYVDYQVSRLFEDLQQLLPFVLEPIPEDMAAIASDPNWYARSETWKDSETGEDGELWFDALAWWHAREMDSAYLRHGLMFRMWRVKDEVHFQWWYAGNEPVWCVPQGDVILSVDEFSKCAHQFLRGVLAAMELRIDRILIDGWTRNDCKLDVAQLAREQVDRTATLDRLERGCAQTDWNKARDLLNELCMKVG